MTLRFSLRRTSTVCSAVKATKTQCPLWQSRSASAMAVPTSSPPEHTYNDISVRALSVAMYNLKYLLIISKKEAALPNHDPPSDSQTAAIVNEHMPYMVATYVRPPPMMVKGEGCYMWDIENRRYLDFTAGIAVNALGHCDPEMAKLIGQQVCFHILILYPLASLTCNI